MSQNSFFRQPTMLHDCLWVRFGNFLPEFLIHRKRSPFPPGEGIMPADAPMIRHFVRFLWQKSPETKWSPMQQADSCILMYSLLS